MWDWYELPDEVTRRFQAAGEMVTWVAIFARWRLVLADLHQWYGVDLDDPEFSEHRSWAWLRDRVVGLLSEPRSRLARDVAPRLGGQGPRPHKTFRE